MTAPTSTTKQKILPQPVPDSAWQNLRVLLRERFGETSFRRWLDPVVGTVDAAEAGSFSLTLTLPTRFMRDWVEAHYGDTIRTLWLQLVNQGQVNFSVSSPLAK